MNKKKLTCIAATSVLLMCCAAPTIAFLTKQTETDNVITFGNVKLQLHETTLDQNKKEVPFDENTQADITHTDRLSRIVRVENVGSQPIYLRVALSMSGTDEDGTPFEADDYVSYQLNEDNWTYNKEDGWYYYKTDLDPETTSEELMTEVIFTDINEITSKYPGSEFKLNIDAQGVQCKNNGANAIDADGWPDNE